MRTATNTLVCRLQAALTAAFGNDYGDWDPQLRAATSPKFGHLQTNLPLRLAKHTGLSPREAGERILAELNLDEICMPPEVAGAGFVNLTWRPELLAKVVNGMLDDEWLGLAQADPPQRIVIDYSSPNVAKQMHVGHLRSTVIGDALARMLSFAGHDVVAQNHIGDWGTQFGMLIEQLICQGDAGGELNLNALDAIYRRARERFETDPAFREKSRRRVVALQSGDPETLRIWQQLVGVSLDAFQAIYSRLGVLLADYDVAGESSYNAVLPQIVEDLKEAGLITESDGALCVFLPEFVGRDGSMAPLIVQKADGGFGYDASDLAALRHRVDKLEADRLIYVVDARQALHFDRVFAVARAARWLPDGIKAQHVAFGTVLGQDGKPFKTRSGKTVSLTSLLDAAERRAEFDGWGFDPDDPAGSHIARAVGIGAVKYADLSNRLERDYVFNLDRMIATDGNTGPYLQYAHARLASLLAKAGKGTNRVSQLQHPTEQRLALLLTGFPATVEKVAATLQPHHMCGYLHEVALAFSRFYETCPVLKAGGGTRTTRLGLCLATKRVLGTGLNLLGILAPEKM